MFVSIISNSLMGRIDVKTTTKETSKILMARK